MASLYSLKNIDLKDDKNYIVYHENDCTHPFSTSYPCKLIIDGTQYLSVEDYYKTKTSSNQRKCAYYKGQMQKFVMHKSLRNLLLATKQRQIICMDNSKDHKHSSMAAIILTNIRDELLLNDDESDENAQKEKEENEDENNESPLVQGNVSQKFNQTYSAVFGVHVLD